MPTVLALCRRCRRVPVTPPRTRCPSCQHLADREWDARRGKTDERGLGWPFRKLRAYVLHRDQFVCGICGLDDPPADQIDHIVPRAAGGIASVDNLRAAHGRCNAARR